MQAASVAHCDIFYGNLSERLGYLAEQRRHNSGRLSWGARDMWVTLRGSASLVRKLKGRQILAKRTGQQQKPFFRIGWVSNIEYRQTHKERVSVHLDSLYPSPSIYLAHATSDLSTFQPGKLRFGESGPVGK